MMLFYKLKQLFCSNKVRLNVNIDLSVLQSFRQIQGYQHVKLLVLLLRWSINHVIFRCQQLIYWITLFQMTPTVWFYMIIDCHYVYWRYHEERRYPFVCSFEVHIAFYIWQHYNFNKICINIDICDNYLRWISQHLERVSH